MAPELIATLVGVPATFAAVVVGVVLQQRFNRARLTFDMHAEFNNSEFTRTRSTAAAALAANPTVSFENLTATLANASEVWLIAQFYSKLWIAIKYKHVDRAMVPDLFGSIYFYWYLGHFERMLASVDYPSTENLKELKAWFDEFAQPFLWRWEDRVLVETPGLEIKRRASLPSANGARS